MRLKNIFLGLAILGLISVGGLAHADDINIQPVAPSISPVISDFVSLAVLKAGDGVGVVTSGNSASQDTKINCGETCKAEFFINTTITLTAIAKEGSKFVGWSGDCKSDTPTQCTLNLNNSKIVTAKFELTNNVITVDPSERNMPRVMFWWGKVNQHWNLEKGIWETDADGISGAREDKLSYCKKFYPTTVKVVEYKNETTNTWRNAYNQGQFNSTKLSYRCVLASESVSQEDVSKRLEKPDSGSICYYYPNLDYCRPFGGDNPGINPPALKEATIKETVAVNFNNARGIVSVPGAGTINPSTAAVIDKADSLSNDRLNQLLEENNQLRNKLKERENEINYLKSLQTGVKPISADAKQSLTNFITYGVDETTKDLSAKERASAVASYKAAFNKLPATKVELADTIKIASGEAPTTVSVAAETKAKAEFKKIYKRAVDLKKPQEASVVKVMAYGITVPAENRDLKAEKAGVDKFIKTYKRTPKSAWDWNVVKAISYSSDVK